MNRRMLWIGVALLGLMGLSALFYIWLAASGSAPRPLVLQRKSLDPIPKPLLRGVRLQHQPQALPVDLNADGETELVFDIGYRREGSNDYPVSLWTDLQGRFRSVAADVFYPRNLTSGGAPSRELIACSAHKGWLMRLSLSQDQWRTIPVEAPATTLVHWSDADGGLSTTVPHAGWLDRDGDGVEETIGYALPNGERRYLTLTRDGRWKAASLSAAPAFSSVSSSDLPLWAANSADWGWFWCGDVDGDGAPDRFNRLMRLVRLSRGGNARFPEPITDEAHLFSAELDGHRPSELVYAQKMHPAVQIRVYRYQNGAFQLIAQKRYASAYDVVGVHDLNSDGVQEFIVAIPRLAFPLGLSCLRLQNQTLHETVYAVSGIRGFLSDAEVQRQAGVKRTLAITVQEMHRWLTPRTETRTALVGFSPRTGQLRTLVVEQDILIWAGDYDGDGNEEYVLTSNRGKSTVAQFRDGAWHVAEIENRAPIAAAAAVRRQGEPVLVLVYRDGALEAVRIRR